MTQWNLIIDVARCENCNNCVLANKDEFVGNDFPGYSAAQPLHGPGTLRIERKVRGEGHLVDAAYLPTLCNHCDNAPCVQAGQGAVTKRADGIVLIDPVKAKGRRDIVDSCPYGSIIWNEEAELPQTWIFDAHLLDQGWQEPRCAQSCPTEAMRAVQLSGAQMARLAQQEQLEVLRPELGTQPRVYYKNLHRFQKSFIGGTVLAPSAAGLDVVIEAQVQLLHNGRTLQTTQTDLFGDFKFDGLVPDSGAYEVSVQHPQAGQARTTATLGESCVLPDLVLRNA